MFVAKVSLTVALATGLSLAVFACGPSTVHGPLVPGESVEVDLDGDGCPEQVCLDPVDSSVTISDGPVFYRSRDKWKVVQAELGDTDRDGSTEVIALLDSEKGRHLGLFAYFGGEYRERFVTQALDPAPSAMEIVTGEGDMVMLLQPSEDGGSPRKALLRWNGFGYTRVQEPPDS